MSKDINKSKTFSFEWHIQDIDQRDNLSIRIRSEFFNLLGCIWHLELELLNLKFRLCRDSVEDGIEAFVNCKLTLLTTDGLTIFEQLVERACEKNSACTIYFKNLSFNPLSTLPESTLIVKCEIVGCNVSVPTDVYFVFRNKIKTERVRRCFSIENVNEKWMTKDWVEMVLYDPIFSRDIKKEYMGSKIGCIFKSLSTTKILGIRCLLLDGEIGFNIVFGQFQGSTRTHLSILNPAGETLFYTSSATRAFCSSDHPSLKISQQDVSYFPDDILRIQIEIDFKFEEDSECDISCFGKGWNSTIISPKSTSNYPVQAVPASKLPYLFDNLQKDLFNMLQNGRNSDFSLTVGNSNIPVHKAILEARSPMFKHFFETNITASSSDILKAVSQKTINSLLLFIYTGQIAVMSTEMARELYTAALKCDLYGLKEHCIEVMIKEFSSSSACELLLLAHENQDKVFKEKIQNCILAHEKDVLFSGEWKKLLQDHTDLALETLQAISELRLKQG